MKEFPPNINPELFSITAMIVGLIIEDDYDANELNSIGNWLILVGQVTLTTAAQQQLINARYQQNNGSKIRSDANDHTTKNKPVATSDDINILNERITRLEQLIRNNKR